MASSRAFLEECRPRVIVCGTRTFADAVLLKRKMNKLVRLLVDPIICTGAAPGADAIAEGWALSRKLTLKRFHAEWDRYKAAAGPKRNAEMVAYAAERRPGFLVAFWDGESPGTRDCVERARAAKLKVRVIRY